MKSEQYRIQYDIFVTHYPQFVSKFCLLIFINFVLLFGYKTNAGLHRQTAGSFKNVLLYLDHGV